MKLKATVALLALILTLAPSALAIQPDSGGWYHTGTPSGRRPWSSSP